MSYSLYVFRSLGPPSQSEQRLHLTKSDLNTLRVTLEYLQAHGKKNIFSLAFPNEEKAINNQKLWFEN